MEAWGVAVAASLEARRRVGRAWRAISRPLGGGGVGPRVQASGNAARGPEDISVLCERRGRSLGRARLVGYARPASVFDAGTAGERRHAVLDFMPALDLWVRGGAVCAGIDRAHEAAADVLTDTCDITLQSQRTSVGSGDATGSEYVAMSRVCWPTETCPEWLHNCGGGGGSMRLSSARPRFHSRPGRATEHTVDVDFCRSPVVLASTP